MSKTKNKDTVQVIFEFPREDYAVLKYMCVKKGVSIKKLLSGAAKDLTKEFLDEEVQKDEDRAHEFPQLSST